MSNAPLTGPRRRRAALAYTSRAFALMAVLGAALLITLAAGCYGGKARTSGNRGGGASIGGQWTATLNPETVALEVPMSLSPGSGGALSGSVAGASIDNGNVSGPAGEQTLQFSTGTISTTGPTGEPMTVEGPLTWNASMRSGQLEGTVTGPDGRSARWTAQRAGRN